MNKENKVYGVKRWKDFQAEELEKDYERRYVYIGEKRVHITEIEDRSITKEDLEIMRMNSYAREDLPKKLNNAAMVHTAREYYKNCMKTVYPCSTYEEGIVHGLFPEMVERMVEQELRKSISEVIQDTVYLLGQIGSYERLMLENGTEGILGEQKLLNELRYGLVGAIHNLPSKVEVLYDDDIKVQVKMSLRDILNLRKYLGKLKDVVTVTLLEDLLLDVGVILREFR